jgi:hypothetical protein
MDLVLSLALRAGLLLYCLLVPGWALLRAAGFSSTSASDRLLACLAAGAASTSLTVTTLLLVGLYYRPVAIVVLLVPLAYLIWSRGRSRSAPAVDDARRAAASDPPRRLDAIDRAVVTAAAGFLIVYLLDAWTSPITWWDGLASWGKWAADWGRRTSSAEYVVGGYPQLVPRIVSVMYKLTGAHSDLLPIDFFALHGFYVLFAAWFLLAAVRLTRVLDMPAWPVVLAGLGSIQFREHAGAGTVDVLVCALVTTLLALYFGLRRETWTARREALVLGAAAFAAIFTKWTGGVGLILLFLLDRASRTAYPLAPDRASALGRSVRHALVIAAVGMLPFVLEQGRSEMWIGRWQPDPFEMNISLRQIPTLLSTDANIVYRGGDAGVRAGLVQLRFWNSYDVPATLRLIFTAFLALCLIASLASWFGRAALPVLLVYGAVWLYWSSYDQRNIFGLLPVLALCASFGAAWLWRLRPQAIWPNVVAVVAGLFLVLAGGGLLKDAQAKLASLTRGDRALAARLSAMRGGVADKVTRFYPQLEGDYRFIAALSERTDAAHVLITYPLFRFFARGAHALSLWPYERVQPGDVFSGHEYHAPPDDPRWVLLSRNPPHRVWLRVAGLNQVTERNAEASPGGRPKRVLYDVQRADLGEGGFVVWQATVREGRGQGRAIVEPSEDLVLDPALSSTTCEAPEGGRIEYRCSGIVALAPGTLARYRAGQLAVGLETDADAADVTLTVARPLREPGEPRRSPASRPATRVSARR